MRSVLFVPPGPMDPLTPMSPSAPGDPVIPTYPVEPFKPIVPLTPFTRFSWPVGPEDPMGPTTPVLPVSPLEPKTPFWPTGPVLPVLPCKLHKQVSVSWINFWNNHGMCYYLGGRSKSTQKGSFVVNELHTFCFSNSSLFGWKFWQECSEAEKASYLSRQVSVSHSNENKFGPILKITISKPFLYHRDLERNNFRVNIS